MELNILDFLKEGYFIVIVALYVIGVFLKQLENVKDKWIVVILMLLGITLAVLLSIIAAQYKVTLEVILNGVLQGILCWGVSVGINQTIKQVQKEE
ncbi:MAG: phage holin family protein [Clostridium sp.]|nr:phage holin family protein [Clostridium sp.]